MENELNKAEKRMQQIEENYPARVGLENNLVSVNDIMQMVFPDNAWLIEKLIPLNGITIVSGAPGSYKTWLIWQMAINIAEGSRFLEQFECEQSAILIIDEENQLSLVKKRLELLGASTELPIHFLNQQDFLATNSESVTEIIRICEKNSINTIFIDSLVRISNADENDAKQMSQVFRAIKHFCQAGKSVVMTHHERKEGTNKGSAQARLRGSSDISAAIDCHLSVRKGKENKKIITIEQPKLRMDEEMPPFTITVISEENGQVRFRYDGVTIDDKTNELKDLILDILSDEENKQGLSVKEITERVRNSIQVGERAPSKVIKELIENGEIASKPGIKNEKICFLFEGEPSELTDDILKG